MYHFHAALVHTDEYAESTRAWFVTSGLGRRKELLFVFEFRFVAPVFNATPYLNVCTYICMVRHPATSAEKLGQSENKSRASN